MARTSIRYLEVTCKACTKGCTVLFFVRFMASIYVHRPIPHFLQILMNVQVIPVLVQNIQTASTLWVRSHATVVQDL